jgi:hypothetical protein
MKFKTWQEQVSYAQLSIASSMSNGYSAIDAINIHIKSLLFIKAIPTFDDAKGIALKAAELNGIVL